MKSFAPFAIVCGVVLLSASGAQAETWIARCNNLQFNFDRTADRLTVFAKSTEGLNREGQQYFNRNTAMINHLFQGKIFSKSADGVTASVPVSNPKPGEGANNFSVFPRWSLTKSKSQVSFAVKNSQGQLMTFKFCTSSPAVQVVR